MTDWKFYQPLFMVTDVTKHNEMAKMADRKFKQQLLSKATEHRGIVDNTSQCRSGAHGLEFEPRHVGFVFYPDRLRPTVGTVMRLAEGWTTQPLSFIHFTDGVFECFLIAPTQHCMYRSCRIGYHRGHILTVSIVCSPVVTAMFYLPPQLD